MTSQLCQSVVVNTLPGTGGCQLSASFVLFGVHLCGRHDQYWRARLARGDKLRIHPDRALPIDLPDPILEARSCTRCHQVRALDQFRPIKEGRARYSWCRQCERDYQNALAAKRRGSGASNGSSAPQGTEDRAIPPGGGESRPAPPETTGGRDRPDPPAATAEPTPPDDEDNDPPGPPVRYEYLAELHCLACERFVSKVTIPRPNAPVIIPERLRCSACGGRPILSGEIERRSIGNPFANDLPVRPRGQVGA